MSSSRNLPIQPPQKKLRGEKEPEEAPHGREFSRECPPAQARPEVPPCDQCRDQRFFVQPKEYLSCPIGLGILPFRRSHSFIVPCCRQLFCSVCIKSSLSSGPKCPLCRSEITEQSLSQQDVLSSGILGDLTSKCDNSSAGCPWQGAWIALDSHLAVCDWRWAESRFKDRGCTCAGPKRDVTAHEDECQFRPVDCDLCKKSVMVKDLKHHMDSECPKAQVECSDCGQLMSLPHLKHHKELCPQRVVSCEFKSFGCMSTFQLCEKPQHLAGCGAAAMAQHVKGLEKRVGKEETVEKGFGFLRSLAQDRITSVVAEGPNLLDAVDSGTVARVEELLFCGVDPDGPKTAAGETLLMVACWQGHLDIARLLISFGADVNHSSPQMLTPLSCACSKGHLAITQLLLSFGANPDQVCGAPLVAACGNGHIEVVKLLLSVAACKIQLSKLGPLPLLLACRNEHLEVAHLLLSLGISVGQGVHGSTPLFLACKHGRFDVVKLLLAHGADLNKPKKKVFSPLFMACHHGHLEVVQLLLAAGASVDHTSNQEATPLQVACFMGEFETAKLLLGALSEAGRVGACIDLGDEKGMTPLNVACLGGDTKIAELLLAHEANGNQPSEDGNTPLWTACAHGHLEIVQLLLSQGGVAVDQANKKGQTPLSIACVMGHTQVVSALLSHGANKDHTETNGISPLHTACFNGFKEIVELLLAAGANRDLKTASGKTAAQVAEQMGFADIFALFF